MTGWKGRRVVITGGIGFIGSNLARRLVSLGADVLLIDSLIPEYGGNLFNISGIENKLRVNNSDVRDSHRLRRLLKGQHVLFNLAGQTSHLDSMTDPQTDLDINCRAQLSILEMCRVHNPKIRIVFASTRQIYGRPERLPVDEQHILRPIDVNGVNKMAGEWYHILYSQVYGIPTCSLRLTNTYGPRMRVKDARQTFVGIWIKNLLKGIPIQIFGDGKQLRDFNYVEDVVDAMLLAATSPKAVGKVFNLGDSPPIDLKSLADLMIKINGSGKRKIVPFPKGRKAIDIGDYYADFSQAKRCLGWKPKVSLKKGLELTLDFYKKHGVHYWK